MISREERERDRAICEAVPDGVWSWEEDRGDRWTLYVNRGEPIDPDIPAGFGNIQHGLNILRGDEGTFDHNGANLRAFIVRAREALIAYIADADEMERRVEALHAARLSMFERVETSPAVTDYSLGVHEGVRLAGQFIRGELTIADVEQASARAAKRAATLDEMERRVAAVAALLPSEARLADHGAGYRDAIRDALRILRGEP